MSTRRRLRITISRKVVAVRGWRAVDLMREAGLRPTFSAAAIGGGGWVVDRPRLPDLLAYLESRNVWFQLEDVDQLELLDGGGRDE